MQARHVRQARQAMVTAYVGGAAAPTYAVTIACLDETATTAHA